MGEGTDGHRNWPPGQAAGRAGLAGGAFALGPLALELAGAADGGGPLAGALFRRLFVMTAQLHLAVDAFALQLLLERAQRLLDIIVANDDLHKKPSHSQKFVQMRRTTAG